MKTMYYHRRKFFFIPLILAAIVLFAYVTMLLWNTLLPEIFNLPVIGFWQAAGLLILARLFFGFGHSNKWGGHSPYMSRDVRSKIKNMTPEEKNEFFRKMNYNREMWHRGCYDEKEQKPEEKSAE